MKVLSVALILALISLVGPATRAEGVGSSGGGIGVYCGAKVYTLDLYEAKFIQKLTMTEPAATLDENILFAYRKFLNYYTTDPVGTDASILAEVHSFQKLFKEVPSGSLTLSQDATLPSLQPGCDFVQIALYDDVQNTIKLDRSLWNQLDFQNQAALILHEGIYKLARENHAKTSDDTRRVVGQVFSTDSMPNMWAETIGKDGILCTAGSTSIKDVDFTYFIYFVDTVQSGKSGVKVYFSLMDGYLMLSETSVLIEGLSVGKIMKNGLQTFKSIAWQSLVERSWNFEIQIDPPLNTTDEALKILVKGGVNTLSSKPFSTGSCMLGHTGSN